VRRCSDRGPPRTKACSPHKLSPRSPSGQIGLLRSGTRPAPLLHQRPGDTPRHSQEFPGRSPWSRRLHPRQCSRSPPGSSRSSLCTAAPRNCRCVRPRPWQSQLRTQRPGLRRAPNTSAPARSTRNAGPCPTQKGRACRCAQPSPSARRPSAPRQTCPSQPHRRTTRCCRQRSGRGSRLGSSRPSSPSRLRPTPRVRRSSKLAGYSAPPCTRSTGLRGPMTPCNAPERRRIPGCCSYRSRMLCWRRGQHWLQVRRARWLAAAAATCRPRCRWSRH